MRYSINEMPFPLHDKMSDARTHWTVTDNKPQCEAFHTATGVELIEEKAPPFRHVSYHAKRGHAQMVADALNREAHPLLTFVDRKDGRFIRVG